MAADLAHAGPSLDGSKGIALVLGTEGRGLSAQALNSFEHVSIPMHSDTCLNVAHAGAVLMAALTPSVASFMAQLQPERRQP